MDKEIFLSSLCRNLKTLMVISSFLLALPLGGFNARADDLALELNAAERELLAKEQALLEQALGPVATAVPTVRAVVVIPTAVPPTTVPTIKVIPTTIPSTIPATIPATMSATSIPRPIATSIPTQIPTVSPTIAPALTKVPTALPSIVPTAVSPTTVVPTSKPVATLASPTATPEIPKKNPVVAKITKPQDAAPPVTPDLAVQLAASRKRVAQLLIELDDAKTRLMVAETQIERLSSIIDNKHFGTPSKSSTTSRSSVNSPAAEIARSLNGSETSPIATIVGSRGILRTGPGDENSALMNLSAGTRVVVETKQGGWYRVITPTGARAWIAASGIAFGANADIPAAGAAPSESLTGRPSALEPADDEERAVMERIRKGAGATR